MAITNLAQYKEKNRLSGREMARRLEISESYLSEIMSGQRSLSKKLAKKISEKTGIPLLNLLYPQGESQFPKHQSQDRNPNGKLQRSRRS